MDRAVVDQLVVGDTRGYLVGIYLDSSRAEHYRVVSRHVLRFGRLFVLLDDLEVERVINRPLIYRLDLGVVHHNKLVSFKQTARGYLVIGVRVFPCVVGPFLARRSDIKGALFYGYLCGNYLKQVASIDISSLFVGDLQSRNVELTSYV